MAFRGWDKTLINTKNGKIEGVAPVIISASRSTDIAAFHSEWFLSRLNAGYIKWQNPFNRKNQYVSFEKCRVIVFWTKNARPMIKYLDEIESKSINYYFTFTVNDYEDEGFEPSVPPIKERIETFIELSERLGKERVIWRFDPLILTDTLTTDKLLDKIFRVGERLQKYTEKLVVSFVDISTYSKVERNLYKSGLKCREFDQDNITKIAEGLQKLGKQWNLDITTCAENCDLSSYCIFKNRCIDDRLMIRIFDKDKDLMDFLGYKKPELNLFENSGQPSDELVYLKDKGQRDTCGCIVSKDIGQYNTCMHLCTYCYANYSENTVKNNFCKYASKMGESIIPED